MTSHVTIEVPPAALDAAAALARECSSAAARERVLVSHAVARAVADYLRDTAGLPTAPGRSASARLVDLLDVCDLRAGDHAVEVRAFTNVERPGLFVPTVPLMVGVLSDVYLAAHVADDLARAELLGFATREELAAADLTANGLFAVLPAEELRPLAGLPDLLRAPAGPHAPDLDRLFDEWREKAEVVIAGMGELFLSVGLTREEHQQRVAGSVRDAFLRIYGDALPATGLEPLFDQLFRRFGIRKPIPSRPGSPVAFRNDSEDAASAADTATKNAFFGDRLGVSDRVSLYRHLLEDDAAAESHRRTRRVLDRATGGAHQATARRRESVRAERAARAESRSLPPPPAPESAGPRPVHTTKDQLHMTRPTPTEGDAPKRTRLEDLTRGAAVRGILPEGVVTVVDVRWHGANIVELTYKDSSGNLGSELLYRDREPMLEVVTAGSPWSFDGDAAAFRLVSEAHRISLAHLFDPMLAVHTSLVEPLPHQITAVYGEMLPRQPLRFLLADDPGAGKTIMTGLLLKELMTRGDLQRCLICAPGSLVEQWQDELLRRFHLKFDILTREMAEAAATGNVFAEKSLLICRLDQLSRNEELQAKLETTDWDVIVCDEAHKMSASFFGGEVKRTKRYDLGMLLGRLARHFLLLTATPHNGKEEDFQLFMALLDGDRFEGKFRTGVHTADPSDLMRRMVKEQLVKFDGTPLFPERFAYTVNYKLSDAEARLYAEVTGYVREQMNRADRLTAEGMAKRGNMVGFALTVLQRRLASSPEAIFQSLRRRLERLEKRLREEEIARRGAELRDAANGFGVDLEDVDDFYDEALPEEVERVEEEIVDQATAARTIAELQAEIATLRELVELARQVRHSDTDRKWEELRGLLTRDSDADAAGELFDAEGRLRKMIVFTEHRDTLNYLAAKIRKVIGRPEAVVTIHGGTARDERRKIQQSFTQDKEVLVLVATDAAGEGINLQRAHLMVNYDLPWNPNRIEQRFGRIHRIGQTEVCHLWNLVAAETREGDVFARLFTKLEQQRETLGGSVFDVLGPSLSDTPLRKLLIDAIRYGDQPEVKAKLFQVVDRALDREHLQALIEERALAHETLSAADVRRIRDDMERAAARKLQPHFVGSFFREAFGRLNGRMQQREPGRFEVTYVPASIRNRDRQVGQGEPVLTRYERITFEKELINVQDKPPAAFVCPGHPLLDVVIDLVKEQHRDLLKRGTVFVDPSDAGEQVRVLFYIEHALQDARTDRSGARRVVSKELQFVEISEDGTVRLPGAAPYLDYRPPAEEELPHVEALRDAQWIRDDVESRAIGYAAEHLVPEHLQRVRAHRGPLVDKTETEVKKRLLAEIAYWDHRAAELKQQEEAGKRNAKLNSEQARKRADDLQSRLRQRLEELKQERFVSPLAPNVFGGALVVPQGLLDRLAGRAFEDEAIDPERRARIDRLAVDAVLEAERRLGNEPREMPHHNAGYDIESRDGRTGHLRFVEVKGKAVGSRTVTVSRSQILYARNKPNDFILAIVEVDGDKAREPRYLRRPFENELDFAVTSVNFDLSELLQKADDAS